MKASTLAANSTVLDLLRGIAVNLEETARPALWPTTEKVRQAWIDLVAWDRWLGANAAQMSLEELQLHEMTLRWAKGIVKLWRIILATSDAG